MKTRKNARAPSDSFTCTMCNVNKVYTEFGGKKDGWPDLEGNRHKWHCRACDCKYNAELHMKNPHARLFLLAKRRAEQKNMEFTLTKEIVKAKFPKDNLELKINITTQRLIGLIIQKDILQRIL